MQQIDHAILRAYNNKPYDKSYNEKLLGLVAMLDPAVKNIVVVVNGPQDKANTPEILKNSEFSHKVNPIVINRNYGWSKALNAGLNNSRPENEYETRLMISNEVKVTPEQLFEMQDQVLRGSGVASSVNGIFTAGSYGLFNGRDEPTYQLPRNTCTLWRSAALGDRRFNVDLDEKQGMEDVHMGLQLYEDLGLLPSLGPIDLGVEIRAGVDLKAKTDAEEKTIKEYLIDFKPETIKAYFGAINVLNLSKGRGGTPLFPEKW